MGLTSTGACGPMLSKGPVSDQSPSSFLMGQMCTQACSALSRNMVGNEDQLRWPGEPGHGGHRWRQTKERIVGPKDQGRRGSGYGEEGVQFRLNCAAHVELAARQGGSGALRAMELPAQSPEVTEQMSGAGLRRRENAGLHVSPRLPPAQPCLEPTVRGKMSCQVPAAGRLALWRGAFFIWVFGGALRQISGVSEYREDVTGWQQQGRGSCPCCLYSSTSVPGAGQLSEVPASGSECQHQTQLMSAVCWVGDSRCPEVRDSTQGVKGPGVKAETEPLREGSERQWWKQHAPGQCPPEGRSRWSAQALVQVG